MAPLIAGIVSTLISNNLPRVAQAVVDKGLDYVQEKTGVEIKPDMTPEEIAALRDRAMQHAEFRIEQDHKNTADARSMHKAALSQDDRLAKRFVIYLTMFWSVVSAAYIAAITFGTIPESNVRYADTILGFLLGTVVAVMLNFWLGSSDSSRKKDAALMRDLE